MKTNKYREAIAAGRIPVGHMVWEFSTRGIAKILDSVDLDFVIFDMEHGGIEIERIADLSGVVEKGGSICAVRARAARPLSFPGAGVMDAGAVRSYDPQRGDTGTRKNHRQCRKVRAHGRGTAGVGLGSAHTDYVAPDPTRIF